MDHMHHDFSDPAKWTRRFEGPKRDAWQKPGVVVAALKLEPGAHVADIGAGTGYFLPHLVAAVGPGGAVQALDISESFVEHMRKRAARAGWENVEARRVAPDDPGLPAASVDRVLIVDTWHHIGGRVAYARKLAAALKPGGFVAIVDFKKTQTPHGPPVRFRLSAEAISDELRRAGLHVEVLAVDLPEQVIVLGHAPAAAP